MGEEKNQILSDLTLKTMHPDEAQDQHHTWLTMADDDGDLFGSRSSESSMEDSTNSAASSFSSELLEDASSSASSSSSSTLMLPQSNGPLYELSELMAQLPIKRGLSKYYQGKSQSYTSLACVMSVEDLAKKGNPYNNRAKMKSCKSYAWGLDGHNKSYSPKAVISKRASRGSISSSLGKRGSLVGIGCRASSITVQNSNI